MYVNIFSQELELEIPNLIELELQNLEIMMLYLEILEP